MSTFYLTVSLPEVMDIKLLPTISINDSVSR